ncbi:MAG: Xaa-Pro peptidase family protein [Chloroflexota bacterium]
MTIHERLARLRAAMAAQGLDALLVSQPENRRYLSGFTGSAGVLAISAERALLATDFRYYQQVQAQAPDFELVQVPRSLVETLPEVIARLGGGLRLGFESQHVTVDQYGQWGAAVKGVSWVPTVGLVENLRAIKDARELALMSEAVRLADEAMLHIMDWIRPGVTEREIAWELEVHMRTHGAQALAFTTIVASGPNGDMPHAVTTDRPVAVGDGLTIDMGAVYQGYLSDLTRSFCLGRATDEYARVWRTVLEAQVAAERAIRAGMSGIEADGIARGAIYGAGYEGRFGHGLGHGVGLAIHEDPPRAGMTSQATLQPDMVLTVEPGIYIPGWGGVRIEDMVVIGADGCRILTQAPKEMVIGRA